VRRKDRGDPFATRGDGQIRAETAKSWDGFNRDYQPKYSSRGRSTWSDKRVRHVASFLATDASAQGVYLTGQYRCIQGCLPGFAGQPAFISQDGWNLNLVNEAGAPSRAWVDWPGHIWAQYWKQGAVVSPDGVFVQFDRGQVWQRDFGPPPFPPTFHY
jgi:hypothetical protein